MRVFAVQAFAALVFALRVFAVLVVALLAAAGLAAAAVAAAIQSISGDELKPWYQSVVNGNMSRRYGESCKCRTQNHDSVLQRS